MLIQALNPSSAAYVLTLITVSLDLVLEMESAIFRWNLSLETIFLTTLGNRDAKTTLDCVFKKNEISNIYLDRAAFHCFEYLTAVL